MNVLFVSKECPPSLRSSGIGTYVWETSNALVRAGHRATIVAASDDGLFSEVSPNPRLTIFRLPDDEIDVEKRSIAARALIPARKEGLAYRRRILAILDDLQGVQKPDVIEFCGFRGESAVWLAKGKRMPMVVKMHGVTGGTSAGWKNRLLPPRRLQTKWERQEVAAADLVMAVSRHEASLVKARFFRDQVHVVYNCIDSNRWGRLSAQAPQRLEPTDILFAGSLLKNKGICVLLSAAGKLRETGWRGRLVLAGKSTNEFERFVRIRSALGFKLPNWVRHLGVCAREHLAGLYRDAGACCFPSFAEAFSYTCLEAMASGAIVIGSRGTGMAELLREDCGYLCNPGDAVGLAAALDSALKLTAESSAHIRNCARERARKHFSHCAIIPELVKIYEMAMSIAS
jgi:glycosyltransferase involved in cell wall biosynthesis